MGTQLQVSKSEFKAKALEYLRRVEASGEDLIVTDRGRPVVRICPVRQDAADARAALRGALLSYAAPTEPVALEDWEALS
jgi:prevent-host-death family protein